MAVGGTTDASLELVRRPRRSAARAGADLPPLWQYAGRTDEVAEPGSFCATRAGHVPVVLVRDEEDELRAFLNVCRHRGSIVCEGSGKRSTLQCPYHAWTYGLDGRLITAPRSNREGGIETDELGLVPLRAETWGPFVFVSPDPDAGPLAEFLEDVPERVAAAGIDVDALRFLRALGVGDRRELEGLRRELPRVLPLPGRTSRLLRSRRRLARLVPARERPATG